MRTRFIGIDYPAPIQPLGTLDFLRLPPPHLPPSNLFTSEHHYCFFDDVSPQINLSLEIDTFPIDNALSKFFSEALPRSIDLETGDYGATEVQAPKEKNEPIFSSKEENGFEVVEFEMPKMDLSLENAFLFEEEKMQFFSEVVEVDNNVDMLDPVLTLLHPFEIFESLFSVDNITPEYCMEHKAFLLEDAGSAQDEVHLLNSTFPLFEVDEISMGISSSISMEEEYLLLDGIEPQPCPRRGQTIVDGKELLGSLDIDILGYLADHCLSKQSFEAVPSYSSFSLEMDLTRIIELSHIGGNSLFQQGITADNSIWSVSPVNFEEFQFLDFDSYPFLQVFSSSLTVFEAETCEQMFVEDLNFQNFNELIVIHELTLVDESFKSLPIPILSDHGNIRSLVVLVEEMLAALKPQPLSASDGIYLDWQFLEEDYSNCDKYSCCWKQVLEINNYCIDSNLKSPIDGTLIFDFVFSGDTPNRPNVEDNKEMLNVLSGDISTVSMSLNDFASSKLLNDGFQKYRNGEVLSDINTERVSTLVQPMPQFNDLNFFLNPREATPGRNSKPAANAFDGHTMFPSVSPINHLAEHAAMSVQLRQWDCKFHQVKLSDNILELIDNFQKSFLAISKSDIELEKTRHSWLAMDDPKLLSIPNKNLMNCIKKTNSHGTSLIQGDDNTVALVSLYAIKQMAWYLCYYGIHATYLYVDKLCRALDYLKCKLGFLETLIDDMHRKAERDITASHPSLSVIRAILQSNVNNCGLKVLIVAEQVFWWPLKRLLTSMQVSYNEVQSFCTKNELCSNNEFIEAKADVLHSDCCIISNEHVSASFPFDKFSIILEYGGSSSSSKVSSLSPKLVILPCLHFLKVELEDSSAPKALCEGVDMPQNIGFTMELEELLNFVPHGDKYGMGSSRSTDEVKPFSMPLPVPCAPAIVPDQIPTNMPYFPDTVIIVNTQNFDKEMIITRRSTYQRILALEKQGTQVVERDLKLPVDVIISAAICLVWYDCRNIGKKTSPDEASSCLPLCIENIAANVLTSLSFTFSCCILVFEGESNFLSTVTESSDELYAAAASLGIDLQLFCSYSSELTDEIILNCIGCGTKLTRHTYPKMPESETLAESFLTTVPSINPLSAHAILSSGGMLVEFLEWSHSRRIRAIQNYQVPDESVNLLSTLCRYGEREDSKSGMTDCSSSVSSAPDSEHCHDKTDSARKKGKYIESPHKRDMPVNDLFDFQRFQQFPDGNLNHPSVFKPRETWMSGGEEIFYEIEKPGVSVGDLCSKKQSEPSGVAVTMSPSKVCKRLDSQMSRGTEKSNEIKKPRWHLRDKFFPEEALDMAPMNKMDCHVNSNTSYFREDLRGEVIDIGDSFSFGEDFSSIANSVNLSCLVPETYKDLPVGNLRTERRLSFDSHPTFSTAAEINFDSNVRVSEKGHMDADSAKHKLHLQQQEKLLGEGSIRKTSTNFPRLSLVAKDKEHCGGTAFSNAVRSVQPPEGSPWTIEFLNRIRAKSRSHLESIPRDMSPFCCAYSGNVSKVGKRKSPSIIDFYKYQGGSTPKKINEKRKRLSRQPSTSSKNEKTSASFPPTWTPLDKRARRVVARVSWSGVIMMVRPWTEDFTTELDREISLSSFSVDLSEASGNLLLGGIKYYLLRHGEHVSTISILTKYRISQKDFQSSRCIQQSLTFHPEWQLSLYSRC